MLVGCQSCVMFTVLLVSCQHSLESLWVGMSPFVLISSDQWHWWHTAPAPLHRCTSSNMAISLIILTCLLSTTMSQTSKKYFNCQLFPQRYWYILGHCFKPSRTHVSAAYMSLLSKFKAFGSLGVKLKSTLSWDDLDIIHLINSIRDCNLSRVLLNCKIVKV